ncbi:tetratricopeptide repeat protein [Kovacikia minuta CCNUW1]|uniref:tetratricopeptide repeat protein n=1 Tax=Kovacikia minuta TaxID=2931930 RepID=UPI001CCA0A42|nr:tetratricopeptide repeat protein [Kovacikia minuta]UBF27427.1 tetratricopeptide repeat protein [Kovacikia minuta CCNUW1]
MKRLQWLRKALVRTIGVAIFTAVLVLPFSPGIALAQSEQFPPAKPEQLKDPSPYTNSFWEKLERLREDRQLQELVEDDLEKSLTIRAQIQTEVDRAFSHTTSLLNVLLGVLTFLPVLAAVAVWFIRRSVINQITKDTKQQLQQEVEKQFEQEIAAELKQQAEAFKQEIEKLRAEFVDQLSQLKSLFLDAQKEKDQIIQELSQITPSPIRESAPPETQQKIQALTKQLELLKSNHAELSFTASDYVEQGKALYFEGRHEDAIGFYDKAIQMEPENPKAWFGRGATLARLQQLEEAVVAYDRAIQIKPDASEAWFGKGAALAKLQQLEAAIAAYDTATQLKPDFFLAWFGKARCYAQQNNPELMLESFQQALHLNPERTREVAKSDPSFDAFREQEEFRQLVAGEGKDEG